MAGILELILYTFHSYEYFLCSYFTTFHLLEKHRCDTEGGGGRYIYIYIYIKRERERERERKRLGSIRPSKVGNIFIWKLKPESPKKGGTEK